MANRKTIKRVHFTRGGAKSRRTKKNITRRLRMSRRRRVRDCDWQNRHNAMKGGNLTPPATAVPTMLPPSPHYYDYNANPSLPDPVNSNDMMGGGMLPRDLIDLGRTAVNSFQNLYTGITTQQPPVSPNVMEQPIGDKKEIIATTDI